MPPPGWRHGRFAMRIGLMVGEFASAINSGDSFAAETGFLLARDPDTVRAPDYAFIRKDQLPAQDPAEAYWPGAGSCRRGCLAWRHQWPRCSTTR